MKKSYGGGDKEVNLRLFGDVLRKMGKYTSVDKMYHCLVSKLLSNDPSLPNLCCLLSTVTNDKVDYDNTLL